MKVIAAFISIFIISGCAGYEFGDGTRAMFRFRQHYCNLAPGAVKEAAHERAKELLGSYPDASWCDGVGFVIEVVHDIEVD